MANIQYAAIKETDNRVSEAGNGSNLVEFGGKVYSITTYADTRSELAEAMGGKDYLTAKIEVNFQIKKGRHMILEILND